MLWHRCYFPSLPQMFNCSVKENSSPQWPVIIVPQARTLYWCRIVQLKCLLFQESSPVLRHTEAPHAHALHCWDAVSEGPYQACRPPCPLFSPSALCGQWREPQLCHHSCETLGVLPPLFRPQPPPLRSEDSSGFSSPAFGEMYV